jgi:hypothetical protein
MSHIGKIVYSGPIGIVHQEKFIKLQLSGLASQVLDQDEVQYRIDKGSALIEKIINRKPQTTIGYIISSNPKYSFVQLPLLSPISSIPVSRIESTYILCFIDIHQCRVLKSYLEIPRLISDYHSNFQMNPELYKKYISQFQSKPDNKKVLDLTHLPTFHIDPPGCVDIDDFLTLDPKQSKIWIHIVDITKYVELGSEQDQRGFRYGYTWYFPGTSIHLLEPLNASEFYTWTLEVDLSSSEPHVELYQSKIKNHYHFTYAQVQEVLDGKKEDPLGFKWSMDVLEKIHPVKYIRQGRRMVWSAEGELSFEEEMNSQRLVAGWMIFYNSWIGKNIKVQDQLLPQRYHPLSKIYDPDGLEDLPDEVKHILWVKNMRQAEYQHQSGHFGLNKEFYTHSTSPLRRYFDRWIQYLIVHPVERNIEVEGEVLQYLNRLELSSERVSDWVHQEFLIQWVEKQKDKLWDAYVIKNHMNSGSMNSGSEIYIYEIQEILFYKGNLGKVSGDKIYVKLIIKNHKIIPVY